MSWFSQFVFDPIKAAAARATTSTNPVARQVGVAAQQAVSQVAQDTSASALSHNSAVGVGNTVVGDLETGFKGVVDSFVYALVGEYTGPAAAIVAPEAVQLVNVGLDFAEQHAMTYIAALFSHHRDGISAAAQPATAPAPTPPPPPVEASAILPATTWSENAAPLAPAS